MTLRLEYSQRELAKLFGVSPQMMGRRFADSGIETGRNIKHTVKEAHEVLAKLADVNQATAQARLKGLEEDGRIKELDRLQKEKVLVPINEVIELVIKPIQPIAKMIKDRGSRLANAANPSDPALAREVIDENSREICKKIQDTCKRLLKKKS